ncbi:hypothetical protein [Nocardia mangyaensis]|uniref:hypothetical protein n=1 Tax=Nocardia mangyaensis TaxID=2213200 RepID=UPI002675A5D2|nr:hypothetical protein [Nocardia mangyaensis]MDO3646207.1 hypothetical protein [Nocardia mangyaensis]
MSKGNLPTGPGISVRWSVAGLLLSSIVAIVVGRVWLVDYASELTAAVRPGWRSRPVIEASTIAQMLLPWAGAAVVGFALLWRSPQLWARISLVATVPAGLITALPPFGAKYLHGAQRVAVSGAPVWSVLTVVAGFALAVAAGRVLTRPLAIDVAQSGVRLRFRLRGNGARLIVAEDRVRLLRPRVVDPAHQRVRELNALAIPLARVESVSSVHLCGTPEFHRLPNGTAVALTEGPGLRITGAGQEWVLPVEDAESVAQLLRARTHSRTGDAGPAPTTEQWQQAMHRRAAIRRSGSGKGSQAPRYYGLGVALFGALTVASFVANDGWFGKLAGATVFVLGALWCSVGWRSARDAVRVGEEWPEPPVQDRID